MKKKDCGKFKEVIFGAGRPFDASGRATSFWRGVVAFRLDLRMLTFHVRAEETLGTGSVVAYLSHETETNDVDEILGYFKELEAHYKKVYGE